MNNTFWYTKNQVDKITDILWDIINSSETNTKEKI